MAVSWEATVGPLRARAPDTMVSLHGNNKIDSDGWTGSSPCIPTRSAVQRVRDTLKARHIKEEHIR